ncbi:TIGR03086 family metal-binding protein [Nocardioides dongxiaopingii]|uniref:TIGR03086 family metal-binding protein n=1 Tax=Nocardioides dongxiaopingii TaxID=2576036 RepID=UPI0010C76C44|nr:TIGR03086 family metal-binding protein [Nocardioides dongxiaopingii]
MSDAPAGGVELLERAIAYTRGSLLPVTPAHLRLPTPCAAWDLDRLLTHMDDVLDAFTEGARGAVALRPSTPLDVRVATLQAKACDLLGAWSGPHAPDVVHVAGLPVPTEVLLRAAALEITVHGWDVAETTRTTGEASALPEALARQLLPVAAGLVADADRGTRFGPGAEVDPAGGASSRLLAFLGRLPGRHLTGPVPLDSPHYGPERRSAS